MAQLNDVISSVVGTPINDGLAVHYGKDSTESLNDAVYRWLVDAGATPASLPDMWLQLLTDEGYTGSVSDMLVQFWSDGGLFSGGGWSGDLINDTLFRIARASTTVVAKNTSLDVQIKVARTSGIAPFGLVFDAYTNSTFYNVTEPRKRLSFFFDYGDAGSTFDVLKSDFPRGRSAEISQGHIGSHVFMNAGSYTVKCFVYDHVTGNIGYKETVITVADPATSYATEKRVYLSTAGDFSLAPAASADVVHVTSWDDARVQVEDINASFQVLCLRGEEIPVNNTMNIRRLGDKQFTSFGNPLLPRAKLKVTKFLALGVIYLWDGNRIKTASVYDIDCEGNYSPISGTGEAWTTAFINALVIDNLTVTDCKIAGMNLGVKISANHTDGNNLVHNCQITDFYDNAIFGTFNNASIRGNDLRQNVYAINGTGQKKNQASAIGFTETGDGVKVAFAHGFDMFGDTDTNLYVAKREIATGIITEMLLTVDYTTTNPASGDTSGVVTYLVAPTALEEVYIYHRRWSDHGSVRTETAHPITIAQCDMFSNAGWFTLEEEQPCLRYCSNGDAGHDGVINWNRFKGGNAVVHLGPSDNANDSFLGSVIFDANTVIASTSTWRFVGVQYGNTVVRNTVMIRADGASTDTRNSLNAAVGVSVGALSDASNTNAPVEIYNNTVVNLHNTDSVNMIMVDDFPTATVPMTDITESNNLIYAPNLPSPQAVNTPLDHRDGNLFAGNPAIDTATANTMVWDDIAGLVRDGTPSLGANDLIGAASNVPPTASAGSDQTVAHSATVALVGTGSTDSDGTVDGYKWTQIKGEKVTLSDNTVASPTFDALINDAGGTASFGLVVTDNDGTESEPDTVDIIVNAVASAQVLTFDGVDSKASMATLFDYAIGDFLQIEMTSPAIPITVDYVATSMTGAGAALRMGSWNRLWFNDSQFKFEFNTVELALAQTSLVNNAYGWNDGGIHTMKFIAKSAFSDADLVFAANNTTAFFEGGIGKITLSLGGNLTIWDLNNGSFTSIPATSDANSLSDLVLAGIDATNWT